MKEKEKEEIVKPKEEEEEKIVKKPRKVIKP